MPTASSASRRAASSAPVTVCWRASWSSFGAECRREMRSAANRWPQQGSAMIRALFTVPLRAALAAVAAGAKAQDIPAGHAFAHEACNACHVVEFEQRTFRRFVIGPAFREIANTLAMTATTLQVFLTSSHPRMPNLILTPEEKANVIAYILSFRDQH